jgi:hypothetical protein
MRERLQRPDRPLQVIGVLATVQSITAISLLFSYSSGRADARSIPNNPDLGELGERLDARNILIATDLDCANNALQSIIAHSATAFGKLSDSDLAHDSTIGGSRSFICNVGA